MADEKDKPPRARREGRLRLPDEALVKAIGVAAALPVNERLKRLESLPRHLRLLGPPTSEEIQRAEALKEARRIIDREAAEPVRLLRQMNERLSALPLPHAEGVSPTPAEPPKVYHSRIWDWARLQRDLVIESRRRKKFETEPELKEWCQDHAKPRPGVKTDAAPAMTTIQRAIDGGALDIKNHVRDVR
jgi:hypothetical protein